MGLGASGSGGGMRVYWLWMGGTALRVGPVLCIYQYEYVELSLHRNRRYSRQDPLPAPD